MNDHGKGLMWAPINPYARRIDLTEQESKLLRELLEKEFGGFPLVLLHVRDGDRLARVATDCPEHKSYGVNGALWALVTSLQKYGAIQVDGNSLSNVHRR